MGPQAFHEEEPAPPSAIEELVRDPSSRKRFLSKLGGTAAASSFAVFVAACGQANKIYPNEPRQGVSGITQSSQPSNFGEGDNGIVNYALFLEYFEADFYDFINNSGLLTGKAYDLSRQIEAKEREHLVSLRNTAKQLASDATDKPTTRFPLNTEKEMIDAAVMIENTGPGAYLGQAPLIRSPDLLATALAIHTVEARQATALNMLVGRKISPDGPFARPLRAAEVMSRVDPMIVTDLAARRR